LSPTDLATRADGSFLVAVNERVGYLRGRPRYRLPAKQAPPLHP